MAQLPQTFPSENWKPRFSSMSQKSKIVFDFFPINRDMLQKAWGLNIGEGGTLYILYLMAQVRINF